MDSLDYCHFKVSCEFILFSLILAAIFYNESLSIDSVMMGVTIAFLVIEIILAIFAICLMVAIRKVSQRISNQFKLDIG